MHDDNHGATVFLLTVLAACFLPPRAGAQPALQVVHEAPLLQGGNQHRPRGIIQGTLDGNNLNLFAAFWMLSSPWAQIDVYRNHPSDGGTSIKNLGILVPAAQPLGGGIAATVTLTDDQVTDLHDGRLYFVVHTVNNDHRLIGGIRVPSTDAEFMETPVSHLWGASFVARGRVRALVTPEGLRLIGFFNGLASSWQRVAVYRGAPGAGGEEVGSFFNYSSTTGLFDGFVQVFALYEGWEDDLRSGLLYVKIHTSRPVDGLSGRLLNPSNREPAASAITSPEDGSYIVIGGETDPVDPDVYLGQVEFTRVEDPDDDPVAYLWQASLSPDFQGPTVTIDVGVEVTRTLLTVEFAAALFDSLAAGTNGGIPLGAPTKVYHRIITTDGSRCTVGPARHVTFVRGQITSVDPRDEMPDGFALHGNYPNPFNPSTTVVFDLPAAAAVTLEVYDLTGRRVWAAPETSMPSGAKQRIEVDGSALASGTYLYRLTARTTSGAVVGTGRMMLQT